MKLKEIVKLNKNMKHMVDCVDFLITASEVKLTKTKKNYMAITGYDSGFTIDCKKWDSSNEDEMTLVVGQVLRLKNVECTFYNNAAQLTIDKSTIVEILKDASIDEFKSSLPQDRIEVLNQKMRELIQSVDNPDCKHLLNEAFKGNKDFCTHPAAESMHHAEKFGLLQHTVGVALSAVALAQVAIDVYGDECPINMDYIITGALLHDVKKVTEYDVTEVGNGQLNKFSMLGHIVLGFAFVHQQFIEGKINEQTYLNVGHIILAHHGKIEYGSPVVPATLDACLVSFGDIADSRVKMFLEGYKTMALGEFSEKGNFGLDRARIYYPEL